MALSPAPNPASMRRRVGMPKKRMRKTTGTTTRGKASLNSGTLRLGLYLYFLQGFFFQLSLYGHESPNSTLCPPRFSYLPWPSSWRSHLVDMHRHLMRKLTTAVIVWVAVEEGRGGVSPSSAIDPLNCCLAVELPAPSAYNGPCIALWPLFRFK